MSKLSKFERWWLDAWPHRMHVRRFVPHFLKDCPDPFRGEVLEVGSGSGWTSRQILETFPQVELTASDVDPRARASFDRLRMKYGQRMKFEQADLLKLPFDRESFDIVVGIHVLHYAGDLAGAVRQFVRVLRPGGLLGLSDVNPDYLMGPLRWLWPASSLPKQGLMEKLLKEEGCEVLKSHGEVHYYVWARKPYPL